MQLRKALLTGRCHRHTADTSRQASGEGPITKMSFLFFSDDWYPRLYSVIPPEAQRPRIFFPLTLYSDRSTQDSSNR
jgi:hypothetical protein